jgi:hypothetical protein
LLHYTPHFYEKYQLSQVKKQIIYKKMFEYGMYCMIC